MTLTTPPVRPPVDPPDPEALEALIEEARRHARRRRRNTAWALLGALAIVGLVLGLIDAGRSHGAAARSHPASPGKPATNVPITAGNGSLTIMAVQADSRAEGPAGYYGISEIGARGRVHAFVRCPGGARWCGEVESVAWAPDGRHLALAVTSFGVDNPYNGIHVIDTKTGVDRQLGPCVPGQCSAFGLAWSPHGKRLAYDSNGLIYSVNADGTGRVGLGTGPAPATAGRSPSWSPDGHWIAFADSTDGDVGVIRADGTHFSLLVRNAESPAWSPDGSTIAYSSHCGIGLVTPAGKDVTPATSGDCRAIGVRGAPAWSPDGRKIAIGTLHRGTYIMNADGSHLIHLSTPGGVNIGQGEPRPSWQPRP